MMVESSNYKDARCLRAMSTCLVMAIVVLRHCKQTVRMLVCERREVM